MKSNFFKWTYYINLQVCKTFSKKDLQNINESIEVVSKITDENKKMNDLETFRKVFLENMKANQFQS